MEAECAPVVQEQYQTYPTGYVQALENHAAMLEHTLNEQIPGTAMDHLDAVRVRQQSIPASTTIQASSTQLPPILVFGSQSSVSPEFERSRLWHQPSSISVIEPSLIGRSVRSHPRPPDFALPSAQTLSGSPSVAPLRNHMLTSKTEKLDEVPTSTAASFFQTYFQCVHPQYPFLSIEDCSAWYAEWKMAPAENPISGWPAFFVKMVKLFSLLLPMRMILNRLIWTKLDICYWFSDPIKIGQCAQISASRSEVSSAE